MSTENPFCPFCPAYLVTLCRCAHACVRSKGVSQKSVLSFHRAGLRYCTQFIGLDNRHVYLLGHVCFVLVISNFCLCLWVKVHVFLICCLLGKLGYCDFCSQPESIVCGSKGSNQAAAWKRLQWVECIPDRQAGFQNGTGFLPFWMMVLGGCQCTYLKRCGHCHSQNPSKDGSCPCPTAVEDTPWPRQLLEKSI